VHLGRLATRPPTEEAREGTRTGTKTRTREEGPRSEPKKGTAPAGPDGRRKSSERRAGRGEARRPGGESQARIPRVSFPGPMWPATWILGEPKAGLEGLQEVSPGQWQR
jgi:hypothetical protein